MMKGRIWLLALLFLAACAGTVTPSGTQGAAGTAGGAAGSAGVAAGWQTANITDTDGVTFSVAELTGKPVFVEFFATWCSNCRRQLADTNEAAATAGSDAIFLALSVETDLAADDLVKYEAETGYAALRYAVLTPEALALVVSELGNSAANPPSTPHLVISADGVAGPLVTGFEDPASIAQSLGLD